MNLLSTLLISLLLTSPSMAAEGTSAESSDTEDTEDTKVAPVKAKAAAAVSDKAAGDTPAEPGAAEDGAAGDSAAPEDGTAPPAEGDADEGDANEGAAGEGDANEGDADEDDAAESDADADDAAEGDADADDAAEGDADADDAAESDADADDAAEGDADEDDATEGDAETDVSSVLEGVVVETTDEDDDVFNLNAMSVGPYLRAVASEPLNLNESIEFGGSPPIDGVEFAGRLHGERMGFPFSVRAYMGDDGVLRIDQLSFSGWLKSRPSLGDIFDWKLLGWEGDLTITESRVMRLYTPYTLVLWGLSNTDQDDDAKLKSYRAIGTGLGWEMFGQVIGPLAIHPRIEGEARTLNRRKKDDKNHVRHEVRLLMEMGVGVITPKPRSTTLDVWAELISQWETRDDDGKSGVDRQFLAVGSHITATF